MTPALQVVGVVASPYSGGSTRAAVDSVLAGAARTGAGTALVDVATDGIDRAVEAIDAADAVVLGSPVYRSTHTALLQSVLEQVQRGVGRETSSPLRGTPVSIVMTGASDAHFLGAEHLRSVLSSFFATQVLSPALYLSSAAFTEDKVLLTRHQQTAELLGRALCELATCVGASEALRHLTPLV